MTDLSRLIGDLCDGLDGAYPVPVSGFPETVSGGAEKQPIVITRSFRSFQHFQFENDLLGSDIPNRSENVDFSAAAHARASSYVSEPERPERPESASYPPLAEALSLFPVKESQPERPEIEDAVACAFSSPDDPLPIPADAVHAGVNRELRALAGLGRSGPAVLSDAIAITAAKIRNSPALVERQTHDGRCHTCDQPLDGTWPEVAILQAKGGGHLWMHAGECHDEHSRRCAALVDRIMAAAGYGISQSEGEAA